MSNDHVSLVINEQPVTVGAGTTILEAAQSLGIAIPTLCWAENLTPANVCRLCVVEAEGARTLVPACSRACEDGAEIRTDTNRVAQSRRMVLELLDSTNDLSQSPELQTLIDEYGADSSRYTDPATPEPSPKIEDDLFIRAYDRCVLCYKCVEACGEDAQFSFAISIADRGFDARVSTEYDVPLPESACVYCGNCIGVCPTNALQFKTEFDLREASDWRPEDQEVTETICSYCGVGCTLELHTQDNQIVKVTSPADHSVTSGHLCVKGRFGWEYLQAPVYRPPSDP
ncbi:MAG: 2Fe-2S iron-sulfur cluster-binding protein [Actinomycetota bacterium]|nr:Fe-S-binding domain-containing protein [Acidimicrobiaceae bacterium]MEC7916625.1 2Fe-2S iron-sulfur cluster-binding protein [Actinomycetota bacterium]MEC9059905.1 2Fe-2S iron-sulfur cluster-binding protein [Actinomycetota bacterium]MED5361278.1 2Fe-2S iron-sulfur cluster-binding protein [Actinomycetota bacterium]